VAGRHNILAPLLQGSQRLIRRCRISPGRTATRYWIGSSSRSPGSIDDVPPLPPFKARQLRSMVGPSIKDLLSQDVGVTGVLG
jgi:hypothetical protein